jgi:hypothetical protein
VPRIRPISPDALVHALAERIAGLPGPRARVLIDGADAAEPGTLADALIDPLRVRGRPVLRVSASAFLRPASLRLERGRHDPGSYYELFVDHAALLREVLTPLRPGGTGLALPTLWDPATDRATRAAPVPLPPTGVLLLDGPMLLGRDLPAELTVHMQLSVGALRRRTPAEHAWTLDALARHTREARPDETADVVVYGDSPGHPAVTGL